MMCSTCNGNRFIVVERPQVRKKNVYTRNGYPCWPHLADSVTREEFPTGRMLTSSEICQDCNGSGLAPDSARKPDCGLCQGTGERNAWDGDEYTVEECHCVPVTNEQEVA